MVMSKNPKAHRAHHYIPQCYLRNFSSNGKFLWIYDKSISKTYQQAIDKTCCLQDFYTLPEPMDQKADKLFLECEFFAKNVEPYYNSLLNRIVGKSKEWKENETEEIVLSPEEKYEFANYFTIQWFRTPETRNRYEQMNHEIMPQLIRILKAGLAIENNNPSYNDLDVGYKIDPVIEHAQFSFYNLELIEFFARALERNYWEFYISPSDNIFTSDYPIVANHHVPNVRMTYDGLACYGSELSFPISKNIVLVIWDCNYFQNKRERDCKFSALTAKEEGKYNYMRYFYAKRQLICCSQDFSLVNKAKKGE